VGEGQSDRYLRGGRGQRAPWRVRDCALHTTRGAETGSERTKRHTAMSHWNCRHRGTGRHRGEQNFKQQRQEDTCHVISKPGGEDLPQWSGKISDQPYWPYAAVAKPDLTDGSEFTACPGREATQREKGRSTVVSLEGWARDERRRSGRTWLPEREVPIIIT
jgi:hypothetical protein